MTGARCHRPMLVAALALGCSTAQGATLAPHGAVYDLSLVSQTEDLRSANGRIAYQLKFQDCRTYAVDYRFVARFAVESEVLVTDQQTLAKEAVDGSSFDFETKTFVDGSPQEVVRGRAENSETKTEVTLTDPAPRRFELPRSHFILSHTAALLDEARAGKRIVEFHVFDGDPEAEKLLTTTAVIAPLDPVADTQGVRKELAGLKRWRVEESYFNSDSDPDGLPVFSTSYVLYENGVSDDLTLDYGAYALRGSLSRLTYDAAPTCP